jgi:hypothetical protein
VVAVQAAIEPRQALAYLQVLQSQSQSAVAVRGKPPQAPTATTAVIQYLAASLQLAAGSVVLLALAVMVVQAAVRVTMAAAVEQE